MELPYNGNGDAVNGRGLRHRKLSRSEALELAADIAAGRPYVPSLHDLASIFAIPVGALRKELKVRTAAQKQADDAQVMEEPAVKELSALVQAWYAASPEERENFLRDEIVRRAIR